LIQIRRRVAEPDPDQVISRVESAPYPDTKIVDRNYSTYIEACKEVRIQTIFIGTYLLSLVDANRANPFRGSRSFDNEESAANLTRCVTFYKETFCAPLPPSRLTQNHIILFRVLYIFHKVGNSAENSPPPTPKRYIINKGIKNSEFYAGFK